MATVVEEQKHLRGDGSWMRVKGRSMRPLMPDGSAVFVRQVPSCELQRGDIVLVKHRGCIVAHRVIKKNSSPRAISFITKGDIAFVCETPVAAGAVQGKVCAVTYRTRTVSFENAFMRHVGLCCSILIPPAYFLLSHFRRFIRHAPRAS